MIKNINYSSYELENFIELQWSKRLARKSKKVSFRNRSSAKIIPARKHSQKFIILCQYIAKKFLDDFIQSWAQAKNV